MKTLSLFLLLLPATGFATVADSAANGFTVKLSFSIQAPPDEVYSKLVHNVGSWWDPAHTFSSDAKNLSIEEKALGCFCEKMPGGGAVRHMELVNFQPGKLLVLQGGLGPMQFLATTGSLTVQFTPVSGGTKLDVTYAVTGYLAAGMNTFAAPLDKVLTEQFTRLKAFAEEKR